MELHAKATRARAVTRRRSAFAADAPRTRGAALILALSALLFGLAQASATAQTVPASVAPAASSASRDSLMAVRSRGVLRVGLTGDYKPFSYLDPATGEYSGLDVDVATMLAQAIGVKLVVVHTSWPTMTQDLLADRFDLAMGGVSWSTARAQSGELTHAYLHDGKVALIRAADKDRFKTLADVDREGVTVLVNPGGTNQKFDESTLHHAKIVVVEKNLSIPAMLVGGQGDVMFTDGVEALYDVKHDARLYAVDAAHPLTKDQKVYYLRQGDATLLTFVDHWIDNSLTDGTYARLRAQWIGN